MKKKILVVEDSPDIINAMKTLMGKDFDFEFMTILPPSPEDPEFKKLIARINDFDAIVWDGAVGKDYTHKGYIQEVKKVFLKPMLAFASEPDVREEQMRVGCTHNIEDKSGILRSLPQIMK